MMAKSAKKRPPPKESLDDILKRLREQPAWERVGRFAALGLREPWQTALVLPSGYTDLRNVATRAEEADTARPILVFPQTSPSYGYAARTGAPKTTISTTDARGTPVKVILMGEHDQWRPLLQGDLSGGLWVMGEGRSWGGALSILTKEIIEPQWIGRVRPDYPGKRMVLPSELVRRRVTGYLPTAAPVAAAWIEEQFSHLLSPSTLLDHLGLPGWNAHQLLLEVHSPSSPAMAEAARSGLKRVAALAALAKAHQHVIHRPAAKPIHCPPLADLVSGLPWPLTPSQRTAAEEIMADLAQARAMRRVLVGDVGSGKTAAFGVAIAGAVAAGARVAVLLPNMPLAEQVHREVASYWPQTAPALVTSDSSTPELSCRLWIGTTAIFHRTAEPFDFVVVDEEQKFSTQQRGLLAGTSGHLLTSSATCIPRSQALARYGAIGLSVLDNTHAKKDIATALWMPEQRRELFKEIKDYLGTGDPLLVIYPTKAPGKLLPAELSVEHAASRWEPLAPGRVRVLDGDAPDETKSAVLADMKEGRADILISTTVVEVGITIPTLRRITLVAPERLGLTTIHQLRGRVARLGGKGWCDLFAVNGLTPKQRAKLDRFLDCKSGFEVAELDLDLRGFGDLGTTGTKQSGADNDFLFGSGPSIEDIAAVEPAWTAICGAKGLTTR